MDIEIICVNDGSTDQTLDIINTYASQDARIQVIDKDNTGYGHTMNLGIDHANGKYIVFLESDDFILPGMCERMYQLCEQYELEILKCDFYGFISKGDTIYRRYYRVSDYGNYGKVLSVAEDPNIFFCFHVYMEMHVSKRLYKGT